MCAVLLLLASCVRISDLYLPSLYHDHLWYPLCTLPELLALFLLLCRPGLVAHIGTAGKALLPAPDQARGSHSPSLSFCDPPCR